MSVSGVDIPLGLVSCCNLPPARGAPYVGGICLKVLKVLLISQYERSTVF